MKMAVKLLESNKCKSVSPFIVRHYGTLYYNALYMITSIVFHNYKLISKGYHLLAVDLKWRTVC